MENHHQLKNIFLFSTYADIKGVKVENQSPKNIKISS